MAHSCENAIAHLCGRAKVRECGPAIAQMCDSAFHEGVGARQAMEQKVGLRIVEGGVIIPFVWFAERPKPSTRDRVGQAEVIAAQQVDVPEA